MSEIKLKIVKTARGYQCDCPIGLWSVFAANKEDVLREASRYLLQYHIGGEYDAMLKARTKPSTTPSA